MATRRVIYKDAQYDVPETFIQNEHPGGATAFDGVDDISNVFDAVGHSDSARELLMGWAVKSSAATTAAAGGNVDTRSIPQKAADAQAALDAQAAAKSKKLGGTGWYKFTNNIVPIVGAILVGALAYYLISKKGK